VLTRRALRLPVLTALLFFLVSALAWGQAIEGLSGWPGKDDPLDRQSCVRIAAATEAAARSPDAATKRLCEAIDEAWKGHPPKQFDSGLNVLEVSFSGEEPSCEQADAQGIDAGAVARLLSHPNLLPPHYSGGLALHNVKLQGPLVLFNATVEMPVVFRNAAFCGGKISRRVLGLREIDPAIYLSGTHFKKRFLISKGDLHGAITIYDSRFESTLGLIGVNVTPTAKSKSSMTIVSSTIEERLLILGGSFAGVTTIRANTIHLLIVSGWHPLPDKDRLPSRPRAAEFFGPIEVFDNDIGSVFIGKAEFRCYTSFSFNRIQGSFRFLGLKVQSPGSTVNLGNVCPESSVVPEFAGNQIGSNFIIQFTAIENVQTINLESNTVKGDADIFLPAVLKTGSSLPWRGKLNLENFQGSARLSIQYSGDAGSDQKLSKIFPWSSVCSRKPDEKYLRVSLNGADLQLLRWGLPLNCEYRWEGSGLRYRNWGGKEPTGSETDLKKLTSWRHVMVKPDLDALSFMADYLGAKGSLSRSREVRREAKELNYRPRLPRYDDGTKNFILGIASLVFSSIAWIFLAPMGWGANPEWALLFLTVGWLGCYWRYCRYSRHVFMTEGWNPEAENAEKGMSYIPGFMQYDEKLEPKQFRLLLYSLDAMLPLINLHHYDLYYPERQTVRYITIIQHVLGWWWLTAFIAAAAIL